MKAFTVVCASILAGVAAAAEPMAFPEELSHLNALVDDEPKLVEAVRQYDVLQQALMEWDHDLARQAMSRGDREQAEEREAMIAKRRDVLEKAYTVLLAYYPKNGRALNYYGEFLMDQRGETAGALRAWKLAKAEDPELSLPYNNLGIYYTHTGEYSRGLAAFQKAIELEPDNPDFQYNLAQIYLIHGPQVKAEYKWSDKRLYKEAMKLSKKAAELKVADYELQQDYAVNFFAAENFGVEADWVNAAEAWQSARGRARRLDEVFYTWLNEARVWLRKPDNARAVACLQEALKILPDNAVAKSLLEKAQASAPAK